MKKRLILPFFNPLEWVKAYRFSKQNAAFDKSSYDLELYLYSKILNNNMLHWGYFENTEINPEEISLKQIEDAQVLYAQKIIEQIKDFQQPILDVGCGMGGLGGLLIKHTEKIELLTPNKHQIEFVSKNLPQLKSHQCKFENFESETVFGTIINSESLQYIDLDKAFEKIGKLLSNEGRWIIVDYFRNGDQGVNKTSHFLKDFYNKVESNNWKIVFEKDISLNVLPTARFVNMYVERFLVPLKHFAWEKLRFKKAVLFYLSSRLRDSIDQKILKERASVDPQMFLNEKKYMFFVLEKKTKDSL